MSLRAEFNPESVHSLTCGNRAGEEKKILMAIILK